MEEFELIFLGFDFPIQTVTDMKKCELYTVQINIILIYFSDNSNLQSMMLNFTYFLRRKNVPKTTLVKRKIKKQELLNYCK